MSKRAMRKNLTQSIVKSIGRYIAIVAIIAIGAGIFVGLRATKTDMIVTGQDFMDKQNMFDLRVLNTYGWSQKEVDQIAGLDFVSGAEGAVWQDVIVHIDSYGDDMAYRIHSIPESINKVLLWEGRMPENSDECLADGYYCSDDLIGEEIIIASSNSQDTLDAFSYRTYTVVGCVSTPLYMDMERGSTSIGNGTLSGYFYIPAEGFNVDYYTEINVTIPGVYDVYTDEYHDALAEAAEKLEEAVIPMAEERLATLKADAEAEYADGLEEYEEGMDAYQDGKNQAVRELADAKKQLDEAEVEIEANRKLIEDGEIQLKDAQSLLASNAITLAESKKTLAETKAETYAQLATSSAELLENYKTVYTSLNEVNSGLSQIDSALTQIDLGILMLELQQVTAEAGEAQIKTMLSVLDTSIQAAETALEYAKNSAVADESTVANMEARLAELKATKEEYTKKQEEYAANKVAYAEQLVQLREQKEQLSAQQLELQAAKTSLDEAMQALELGMLEMQNGQTQADNQFSSAEAQLEAGQVQIEAAQSQLELKIQELAQGKITLEEAEAELEAGWEEYYTKKAEVEAELADAKSELDKAKVQLDDARKTIDEMTETSVFALSRTTNIGYQALDSNSDIVAGVSRVFPAFFLAVAALVCITTMTRMVSEERTQIGSLKALGYGNFDIVSKYLVYAGSGAVIGCGFGIVIGSVIFPVILWQAYGIILHITPQTILVIDWPLCVTVVVMYVIAMLLTSWYCCRRELREVPAELIRPKAPTSGKKIFLEYFGFWNRISFLNKVMFRNIFRYRQRFLMMLLGVGGCTALLITGFGLRDSIVGLGESQYSDVCLYDIQVYFPEGQSEAEQDAFRDEVPTGVDKMMFLHQSSVELLFEDNVRDVVMLSGGENITDYIDFHFGKDKISLPGKGEAIISVGVSELMDIQVGDEIEVRNLDMETIVVTVSGIFKNHINNYIIVSPETIQEQLGYEPEQQIAFLNVRQNKDVHDISAVLNGTDGILNVSVSVDTAKSVESMMGALDMVVILVVVCAGLLAATVLYNLTNINIKERIREIATIKVLGFNSRETCAYVFKENLLLSAMGAVAGLGGGKLLLNFVISQIRIDFVWLPSVVSWKSSMISLVVTLLMACIVDFIFYFKLEKINMAEALKSVE